MQRPTNDRPNFQFIDESDRNKKRIRRFTTHELEILRKAFLEQPKPRPNRYKELACQLDCSSQKVRSYFANRRAQARIAGASTIVASPATPSTAAQPSAMPAAQFPAGGFPARPVSPLTNQAANSHRLFSPTSDGQQNPAAAAVSARRSERQSGPY